MLARTILKVASQIPWDKVIELAPSVAERAGTLWKSIKSKNQRQSVDESMVYSSYSTELSESDLLKGRLERLEERAGSLEEQLQASAGLLKTLAEQNTSLVQQIELHQARLIRQSLLFAGVGAVLAGMIVYLFIR
jgi:predicted nuclease with TOPRIM domain